MIWKTLIGEYIGVHLNAFSKPLRGQCVYADNELIIIQEKQDKQIQLDLGMPKFKKPFYFVPIKNVSLVFCVDEEEIKKELERTSNYVENNCDEVEEHNSESIYGDISPYDSDQISSSYHDTLMKDVKLLKQMSRKIQTKK